MKNLIFLAVALLTLSVSASAQNTSLCGDLSSSYGPFDYRRAQPDQKALVEGAHFTATVESLIRGATSGRPGGDIQYTLRVFPNHHRALVAVIRLGLKEKTDQPQGMRYTVECWLDRAVRFQPDDGIVRMIRAGYFGKNGRRDAALADMRIAESLAGDNPFTHYSIGMSFFELGEFEKALSYAHSAAALGMPRTELMNQLKASGHWRESIPPSSPASAALQ